MNRLEVDKEGNNDFWYSSRIIDQGDLSTYYGYETFDASGYRIRKGKVHPETIRGEEQFKALAKELMPTLKAGYTYVRMEKISPEKQSSKIPIHLIGTKYELPDFNIEVGVNPTFLLEKDGEFKYAVINGFLIDLESGKTDFKNAMIYR